MKLAVPRNLPSIRAVSYATRRAAHAIDQKPMLGLGIELFSLLVLIGAVLLFGNRHFGGFDQSVIVGAAYRFWEHQQPYRDFVMTVPVLFYLGAGLAFRLCGVSWLALISVAAAYAAGTYWVTLWALKQLGLRRIWAIAVAFTAESLSMVLVAYWWYNPVTSITVSSFLVLSVLVLQKPEHLGGWMLWTAMTVLLSLTKPNSAGLVLAGSAFGFLLRPAARKKFLLFSGAAAVVTLVILLAFRLNPQDVVHSYLSTAGRGYPSWERFTQDTPPAMVLFSLALIGATLIPWVFGAVGAFWKAAARHHDCTQSDSPSRFHASEWVVLMSGTTAAFLAFFTNGEIKATDLPMLFVPVALSSVVSRRAGYVRKFYLATLMLLLSATGFTLGAERYRVRLIGPGAFYQLPAWGGFGWYSPFFEHLKEGYNLHAVMAATSELMSHARTKVGPSPKVFFGPRMEFNYAAHSLDSPLGLPLFWHEGVGYPSHLREDVVGKFRSASFELCVFLRGDFTYMPSEILSYLQANYRRIDTHALTVFYRRSDLIPPGFDPSSRLIPAYLYPVINQ